MNTSQRSNQSEARDRIAQQRRLAAGIQDRRQRDHMIGMLDRFERNRSAIDGQREETRGGNVIRVVESREQIGGGAMTPTAPPPQSRTETFGPFQMIITTAIG